MVIVQIVHPAQMNFTIEIFLAYSLSIQNFGTPTGLNIQN